MARHIDYEILPGATAAQIWKDIQHYLSLNESVEVVKEKDDKGRWRFELRVWTGVRKDGSNGPEPPATA